MENSDDKPVVVISEKSIKDKIHILRGQKVMIDADLAEIYGYTTKRFNQQVKNNIQKFDDDFRFQLTQEEMDNLRSKNLTSSWGGTRYLPYAFTEQGIYMLMTVLKGELATRQSKSLIRLFKRMKDYLIEEQGQIGRQELLALSMQTQRNTDSIEHLQSKLKDVATKDDLAKFMQNFLESSSVKEYLFWDGQVMESSVAYGDIYGMANHTVYVVDNYIGLKTLLLLKNTPSHVSVTIFSDNLGKGLSLSEYDDFYKEYPNVKIDFRRTCGKYHDCFIILDCDSNTQKVYHCGGSSKDGGKKVTAIAKMEDTAAYRQMVDELLKNPTLVLS